MSTSWTSPRSRWDPKSKSTESDREMSVPQDSTGRAASMEGKRPAEAAGGTGSAWTVHPCCPEETRAVP
ncbi:hypothetical protein CYJ26_03070 [Actinomyces urogenitalis]|uniref:Uncharacterized protein n=2 Tax=root TaxID=1 RepID=A0A2I1KU22_9ACTO|nr:hypothetical protein CYJ26_03070 [Actinomyces urogenitalis]